MARCCSKGGAELRKQALLVLGKETVWIAWGLEFVASKKKL
jgi:hypothetical protein